MFFFNGRIRNAHIVPMITHDRSYTHKVGQSSIIAACLSIIIGLILIVIGVISETKKTTFFGIGITSLGGGFSFTALVCFYTKLNICYRNWAYGSHIAPNHMENSQLATAGDISIMYLASPTAMRQKAPTVTPLPSVKPVKKLSNVEIHKVRPVPSRDIGETATNTKNVT